MLLRLYDFLPISSVVKKYSDVAIRHDEKRKSYCHDHSIPNNVSLNVNPIVPQISELKTNNRCIADIYNSPLNM